VWNDIDDDDVREKGDMSSMLCWSTMSEEVRSVDVLYIAIGREAVAYTQHTCPHRHPVGCVAAAGITLKGTPLITNATDPTCVIYQIDGVDAQKCLLIECVYRLSEERAFEWTQAVFARIAPERVVVLSWLYKRNYISSAEGSALRILATDTARQTNFCIGNVPFLETSNVIDNECASVLTHCQVHNISGVVCICVSKHESFNYSSFLQLDIANQLITQHTPIPPADTAKDRLSVWKQFSKRFNFETENPLFM